MGGGGGGGHWKTFLKIFCGVCAGVGRVWQLTHFLINCSAVLLQYFCKRLNISTHSR